MSTQSPQHLSDRDLIDATVRAAGAERSATVALLRLLAELDSRRLYLGEGCSSLFTYCTQVLCLSEHAAYHRIEAARAARAFPVIFGQLMEGALTLTTVALLRPHLTNENHARLLESARFKSKRDVELQVASLAPKPDVKPTIRRVPQRYVCPAVTEAEPDRARAMVQECDAPSALLAATARTQVAPTAPDRYLIKVTVNAETHAKLRRARDLLRHTVPNGDPAAVLDRALTLLVEQLERRKAATVTRPRSATRRSTGRHVPASVKREVWARDGGRCAFEGPRGRCRETGRLEFHHRLAFADGGLADAGNIALRCRAHNSFESQQRFGPWRRE